MRLQVPVPKFVLAWMNDTNAGVDCGCLEGFQRATKSQSTGIMKRKNGLAACLVSYPDHMVLITQLTMGIYCLLGVSTKIGMYGLENNCEV